MKKHFFILLIFFFSGIYFSHAQQFKGGVQGGFSFSQIDGDGSSGFNKIGGFAGFFVKLKFADNWGAELGAHYIMKGSKQEIKDQVVNPIRKVLLGYLEMPFLLNYYYNQFTIDGGICIGYNLHAGMYENDTKVSEHLYNYADFDYSATFGISYKISKKTSVILRYSHSLNDIADFKNLPFQRNRTIWTGLRYQLN